MKRLLVTLGLGLSSLAAAQQVGPYQSMLEAIGESQGRIVVYAPSIFDLTLADALRQAKVDYVRKPVIRVLTVPYYNYLPSSTALSLALIAVPVYEAQVPSREGFVIVDNQGWIGARLGQHATDQIRLMTPAELNASLKWMQSVLGKSHHITQYEAFTRLKKVIK